MINVTTSRKRTPTMGSKTYFTRVAAKKDAKINNGQAITVKAEIAYHVNSKII